MIIDFLIKNTTSMKQVIAIFLIMSFTWGCDEPEPIPAYIRIEPFTINASAGGNAMHEVTEGWIYVNNELLGGFYLPAEIPVLAEGAAEVQIFPGVKVNGLKSSPGVYPMFKRFIASVTLTPGETTTVQPTTEYQDNRIFPYPVEQTTFDGISSINFVNRDFDENNAFTFNNNGYQGKCIQMYVDTAHTIMEIASEQVPLPNTGDVNVWLEMHHQNDVPFSIQIVAVDATGFETAIPLFLFNPTAEGQWNKIYFNLTDYLPDQKKPFYKLFYRLPLPIGTDGKYTAETGTVKLDNIRLVHF
jgi:hypothetical protein